MYRTAFGKGEPVGGTQFYHEGIGSAPDLGSEARGMAGVDRFCGQTSVKAIVDGGITIHRGFTFGAEERATYVGIYAYVMGQVRLTTNRIGNVGGSLHLWVGGSVLGNVVYDDKGTQGGFAEKRIICSASHKKGLVVKARGRANLARRWSLMIKGDKPEQAHLITTDPIRIDQNYLDRDTGDRIILIR